MSSSENLCHPKSENDDGWDGSGEIKKCNFEVMPESDIVTLYRLAVTVLLGILVFWESAIFNYPPSLAGKKPVHIGRWRYLYFWNVVSLLLYFAISGVGELFGWVRLRCLQHDLLSQTKAQLFASIIAPLSLFECATFQVLYLIDRETIHPARLDSVMPFWQLVIGLYYLPLILVVVEMAIGSYNYPNRFSGLFFALGFMSYFFCLTLCTRLFSGVWSYPLLHSLTFWNQALFFASSAGLVILSYLIMEAAYLSLNGKNNAMLVGQHDEGSGDCF